MAKFDLDMVVGVALVGVCGAVIVGVVGVVGWGVAYSKQGSAYCATQKAISARDCQEGWNNGGQKLADMHIAIGESEARYWVRNGATKAQDEGVARYTVFQAAQTQD